MHLPHMVVVTTQYIAKTASDASLHLKKMQPPVETGAELLPHMVSELTRKDHKSPPPASPRCWLVKFAPFRTSWTEIVQRGTFTLRGVRSPVARKHLSEMRVGDPVLFYHSQKDLAVVGVMEVSRDAYPDPTSSDPRWLTCDFIPIRTLARPVTLKEIKTEARLSTLVLVRQPRLAVMPLSAQEFQILAEELPARLPFRARTGREIDERVTGSTG